MDGGGRLAGSLNLTVPWPGQAAAAEALSRHHASRHQNDKWRRSAGLPQSSERWRRYGRSLDRMAHRLSSLPRYVGVVATLLMIVASASYGAVRGGQADKVIDFVRDIRDSAATAAGFPIATVAISGEK